MLDEHISWRDHIRTVESKLVKKTLAHYIELAKF